MATLTTATIVWENLASNGQKFVVLAILSGVSAGDTMNLAIVTNDGGVPLFTGVYAVLGNGNPSLSGTTVTFGVTTTKPVVLLAIGTP